MKIFKTQENRITCGRCGTNFDLDKNNKECPLCGFGKNEQQKEEMPIVSQKKNESSHTFLSVPPALKLKSGRVTADTESKVWGSWLMFNDFFAPKFLTRITAWKISKDKQDYILLSDLIKDSVDVIGDFNLNKLKGFPNQIKEKNLEKDAAVSRLVNHFLRTFSDMGLFEVRSLKKGSKDVWKENWKDIEVTLTKEGLEFALLKNNVFDNASLLTEIKTGNNTQLKNEQILSSEEKEWMLKYLRRIDSEGYKEYSTLQELYTLLKAGNQNYDSLLSWFAGHKKFSEYIKERSKRAQKDEKLLQQQIENYAASFISAKISLLRELGIVENRRNNYTITGDWR